MNLKLTHRFRGLPIGAIAVAALTLALAPAAAQAATVKEYPQEKRTLSGWWANENVPAYKCPIYTPYLENRRYAPAGTTLVPGVSINQQSEPWPIGVSITRTTPGIEKDSGFYATGISSAWDATSATNWTFGTAWYQVVLHCTSDPSLGYEVGRFGEPPL